MKYKIQNIFIKKASSLAILLALLIMFVSSSAFAAVGVSFSATVQPNSIIVTGLTRTCDGEGELNVQLTLIKVPSYDPLQVVPVPTLCNVPSNSNVTFNNLSPGDYFIQSSIMLGNGTESPSWQDVAHGPWAVTGTGGGTQQNGNNGNTDNTDGNTDNTGDGNTDNTGDGNTDNTGDGNTDNTGGGGNSTPSPTLLNPISVGSIQEFIAKILDIVLTIGVPIVALAIIYSGFLFVMARGNTEKLEDAKQTLVYVLIGAALLLGAWVIANAIVGTINQIRA